MQSTPPTAGTEFWCHICWQKLVVNRDGDAVLFVEGREEGGEKKDEDGEKRGTGEGKEKKGVGEGVGPGLDGGEDAAV